MRPDEHNKIRTALDALTPDEQALARVRGRLERAPAAVPWVRIAAAVTAAAAVVALVIVAMPRLPMGLPAENSTPTTSAQSTASQSAQATTESAAPTTEAVTTTQSTSSAPTTRRSTTVRVGRETTAAPSIGKGTSAAANATGKNTRPPTTTAVTVVLGTTQTYPTIGAETFYFSYEWEVQGRTFFYDGTGGVLRCTVNGRSEERTLLFESDVYGGIKARLKAADIALLPESYTPCEPVQGAVPLVKTVGVSTNKGEHVVRCEVYDGQPVSEQARLLLEALRCIEESLMATEAWQQLAQT